MSSFPGFVGFVVGFLDAMNKVEEAQQKISAIMLMSGILLAYLGGIFNSEWAVNSAIELLIKYLIGVAIGELIGALLSTILGELKK
jgi:hypothetical protein